ncbi:MAG: tRNA (adenosine(37)-N6)-dimethylallyltransferase, partial [Planktomarina sp.]
MKKSVFPDFTTAVAGVRPDQPVLIAGCTASGKSALALQIAAEQGGVVVNADAMQVYDNWSVLTARPPAQDLAEAPHVLYGHVDKRTPYSVGDWLRDITPIVNGPERPIIVGGTGLFFRALTEGLVDIPPIPDDIRTDNRTILADHGIGHLIKDLDAETLSSIDTHNPARVGRAWEVQKATGRSILQWQAMTPPPLLPLTDSFPIHLDADPAWLEERIARR